jgi:hypothetical protein
VLAIGGITPGVILVGEIGWEEFVDEFSTLVGANRWKLLEGGHEKGKESLFIRGRGSPGSALIIRFPLPRSYR